MTRRTSRPSMLAIAASTTLALAVAGIVGLPAPAVAAASVTIDDPGVVSAGDVTLRGRVFQGPARTTTVLYAVDATNSTADPAGADCTGDGVVTPGSGGDDLNADGSVGDTLDCEIAGVRALDAHLAENADGRLQVGLIAFANLAAAADLSPDGSATFVPPGFTGGDAQPRVVTAAASVVRNQIGAFDVRDLGGSGEGTAFNNGIQTALDTLRSAPPGPKWVMFLSDGLAPLADSTLASLEGSGVRLRSFAIGGEADCNPGGGLAKMAAATGETCVDVANPAALAAQLQGAQPENVTGVSVTVGGTAFAADVDPVGGWRVGLRLGKGTYTVRATATLSSGATVSSQRTITVGDPAPGRVAPPPGSVGGGTGTMLATQVSVDRPKPTRARLPRTVSGSVGKPGRTPQATRKLDGATILLQGRRAPGSPWVTLTRGTVSAGDFTVRWKRKKKAIHSLRVQLQPFKGLAASVARVPAAPISSCRRVNGANETWTLTCATTAKKRTPARLLLGKDVADRAKVRKGLVRVEGEGRIGRYVLVVDVSKKRHLTLPL